MTSTRPATHTWKRRVAGLMAAGTLALTGLVAQGAVSPTPAHAASCTSYTYSYGGYSTCIRYIQDLLNFKASKGVNRRVAVDGAFGTQTRAAVIELQRWYRITADGIVGPVTWRRLCSPDMGPGPVPGFPYASARAAGCNI